MFLEIVLLLLIVLISCVTAESFNGRFRSGKTGIQTGSRRFIAPDIPEMQHHKSEIQLRPADIPMLSEFSYYYSEDSEVSAVTATACRKCMIAGNVQCVTSICRLDIDMSLPKAKVKDVHQQAFATGTSLHGDILCSLCKHTRDVMCTMKLCVDPERGQNAIESGVQCMQGFCRWQKEAVVNTGFNNYYHAWWQPQNLYFFFDHVTKEIATAYNEFISSTSQAINELG